VKESFLGGDRESRFCNMPVLRRKLVQHLLQGVVVASIDEGFCLAGLEEGKSQGIRLSTASPCPYIAITIVEPLAGVDIQNALEGSQGVGSFAVLRSGFLYLRAGDVGKLTNMAHKVCCQQQSREAATEKAAGLTDLQLDRFLHVFDRDADERVAAAQMMVKE
jgi:hypothetical protein